MSSTLCCCARSDPTSTVSGVDGSRQVTATINADGTGKNFVNAEVLQNGDNVRVVESDTEREGDAAKEAAHESEANVYEEAGLEQ